MNGQNEEKKLFNINNVGMFEKTFIDTLQTMLQNNIISESQGQEFYSVFNTILMSNMSKIVTTKSTIVGHLHTYNKYDRWIMILQNVELKIGNENVQIDAITIKER